MHTNNRKGSRGSTYSYSSGVNLMAHVAVTRPCRASLTTVEMSLDERASIKVCHGHSLGCLNQHHTSGAALLTSRTRNDGRTAAINVTWHAFLLHYASTVTSARPVKLEALCCCR